MELNINDGQVSGLVEVFTYSTCRRCRGLLHITDNDTVHPDCQPAHTKMETLAKRWIDAVAAGDTSTETELRSEIDAMDTAPPRMLDAALKYASWGWPVFPLKQHAKTPATRNGFKDATTDINQITAWWTAHPQANIGAPTGYHFDVIDIDPPDGTHSYLQLLEENHIPDIHGQVATASGGIHFYIKPSGDGNTVNIAPGIDYRGRGGYVVCPPSTLGQRGRSWSWTSHPSPIVTGVGDTYRD